MKTVKLIPNAEMRELLDELVQGRTINHIECVASKRDIAKMNAKKSLNLGKTKMACICTNTGELYESIKAASIALDLDAGAISRCVNGKQDSVKGRKFQLVPK